MDDKELMELAEQVYRGEVFTSWQIPDNQLEKMLPLIFMPMIFANKQTLKKMNPYVFYAYMKDAAPRTINGFPMFLSMAYLEEGEGKKLWDYLQKIRKAMETVKEDLG